jgi:hypothetical protein
VQGDPLDLKNTALQENVEIVLVVVVVVVLEVDMVGKVLQQTTLVATNQTMIHPLVHQTQVQVVVVVHIINLIVLFLQQKLIMMHLVVVQVMPE